MKRYTKFLTILYIPYNTQYFFYRYEVHYYSADVCNIVIHIGNVILILLIFFKHFHINNSYIIQLR